MSAMHVLSRSRNTRVTWDVLAAMYERGEPLTALVLHDRFGAELLRDCRVDIAVASFSDGMPEGVPCEQTATAADLLAAITAIRAVNDHSFVVGDIPYGLYRAQHREVRTVARLFMDAGADAVKIEGGVDAAPLVRELRNAGIPVVGHIGYMPKTGMRMRTRGRDAIDATALCRDALALREAGVSALVVELVDESIAACLTAMLDIPTIGIYSGARTSGQVLVLNDVLDVTRFDPSVFPKGRPARIGTWEGAPEERVQAFHAKVKAGLFPEARA